MDTSAPKEIIVKLWDYNTLDSAFQKKFAAVFVQQDRRYIDMLLVNEKSSEIKLLYNPYSKIKFTLKNLQTNQVYGHASIVMRLLKDLRGKQRQVLPLDGNTYDELLPGSEMRPNIELEYQWHISSPKPIKTEGTRDVFNSGLQSAQEELANLISQLEEL